MQIDTSYETDILALGQRAKAAARQLALTPTADKQACLLSMAHALRSDQARILQANQLDLNQAKQDGVSDAMLDRLTLTSERIDAMAAAVEAIAQLPDPVGRELAAWDRPNGLHIARVSVPLGVIGVIYEARPNVTADAAALCLLSGNAVILRGGSSSFASSMAIMRCIRHALLASNCPEYAVQMIETAHRDAVGQLLKMDQYVDVIVPRGGRRLIERITEESRIPLFKHLEGLCHTYVHSAADRDMALSVVFNAKCRRPGICGATETVLMDRAILASHLPPLLDALIQAGCEVRGDASIQALDARVIKATEQDWQTEYLDRILSIKAVDHIDEAIDHINTYGSQHTDAIITNDPTAATQFLAEVESAIVMHNTSTQFADGGEFGMGAEIGISTGKLHARGPVGVEQLTTYKYQVSGSGQTRPAQ